MSARLKIAPKTETPAPKIISGISVIFDWGPDRGESFGAYSQADIVDVYGARLNDELEYEDARVAPVDTRKRLLLSDAQRLDEVPAGFVPVFLSCDWHARRRDVNSSSVEFCGEHLYKLADALCFALAEWGRGRVYGHRVLRPVAVEGPRDFVRVKPFALNGPSAGDYVLGLEKLGEDLGRAIGEFLTGIGAGKRRN